MWMYLLLLSSTDTLGCSPGLNGTGKHPKYFSNNTWGGWHPSDDTWMNWIKIWADDNSSVAFDSTEVGRDPESGWPRYWKGLGKGNPGVPPPPWAYVPESYGKPSFCYMQPKRGDCKEVLVRWGFNPTNKTCERFPFSGCGGNENNFRNKYECMDACGRVPDTDCGMTDVNFRDYIDD